MQRIIFVARRNKKEGNSNGRIVRRLRNLFHTSAYLLHTSDLVNATPSSIMTTVEHNLIGSRHNGASRCCFRCEIKWSSLFIGFLSRRAVPRAEVYCITVNNSLLTDAYVHLEQQILALRCIHARYSDNSLYCSSVCYISEAGTRNFIKNVESVPSLYARSRNSVCVELCELGNKFLSACFNLYVVRFNVFAT